MCLYPATYKSKMGYTLKVEFDTDDRTYVVHVQELKGCATHGNSLMEALNMAEDAIEGWIECCQEKTKDFPLLSVPLPQGYKEQVLYYKKLEDWNKSSKKK